MMRYFGRWDPGPLNMNMLAVSPALRLTAKQRRAKVRTQISRMAVGRKNTCSAVPVTSTARSSK